MSLSSVFSGLKLASRCEATFFKTICRSDTERGDHAMLPLHLYVGAMDKSRPGLCFSSTRTGFRGAHRTARRGTRYYSRRLSRAESIKRNPDTQPILNPNKTPNSWPDLTIIKKYSTIVLCCYAGQVSLWDLKLAHAPILRCHEVPDTWAWNIQPR
jgi:hypothetical protein